MRTAGAVVTLVLLAARPAAAQTEIRMVGDSVELRIPGAPLSDVLDRLARQTGMKVIYDGPPPRARISIPSLVAPTPMQAVLAVLEGQGLNFAIRMDPTGRRIDTLVIVAGGAAPVTATPPRPEGPRLFQREREREPEPPEPEEEPVPAETVAPTEERERRPPGPIFPPLSGPAMPLTLPSPTTLPAPTTPTAPVPPSVPSPAPPQ